METLTIQVPEGAEGKKVKAVLKALGVTIDAPANGVQKNSPKEKESLYDPAFVAKIEQGKKDLADGKGIRVTLDEIWK